MPCRTGARVLKKYSRTICGRKSTPARVHALHGWTSSTHAHIHCFRQGLRTNMENILTRRCFRTIFLYVQNAFGDGSHAGPEGKSTIYIWFRCPPVWAVDWAVEKEAFRNNPGLWVSERMLMTDLRDHIEWRDHSSVDWEEEHRSISDATFNLSHTFSQSFIFVPGTGSRVGQVLPGGGHSPPGTSEPSMIGQNFFRPHL